MNNWLIKGNPARNNFDEMLLRTGPDKWVTRKPIPPDFSAGDRVFLYESSPSRRLIALASVHDARLGREEPNNLFAIKYESLRLKKMLYQDEIKLMPGLEDASFLKSGNVATIYRLSAEQAGILLQAIIERNPYLDTELSISANSLEESLPFVDQDALFAVPEGNPILRAHLIYERAPGLAKRKKLAVKAERGSLDCEVCDFNFLRMYENRGLDFCEVHHRFPLAKNFPRETALADLAIVCSNCHRMLHRQPLITVEELRKSIFHMRPALQYKGYEGSVIYGPEDHLLYGRLLGIRDSFSYDGTSIAEIEASFHETVEEYISDCRERGKPIRAYETNLNESI